MSRPRQSKAAAGGAMKSLGAASRNNKDGFPIPLQFLYRDPRNVMLKRRGTDPEIDAEDGSNGGRMQERQREQRTLFAASMAAGRASFGQHRWTDAKRSFTKVKTQIRPRRLFFSFALMLDASGSSTRRPSPSYVKDERKPSVYVSGERVVWWGGGGRCSGFVFTVLPKSMQIDDWSLDRASKWFLLSAVRGRREKNEKRTNRTGNSDRHSNHAIGRLN